MTDHTMYNRQISTESGWDNPFRPDGDLSREADEIVSLIKGGKPITPTPPVAMPQTPLEEAIADQMHHNKYGPSSDIKIPCPVLHAPPPKPAMNGTKNGSVAEVQSGQVEVKRALPQEPQEPEHVTIRKKPKCKCCVVQ